MLGSNTVFIFGVFDKKVVPGMSGACRAMDFMRHSYVLCYFHAGKYENTMNLLALCVGSQTYERPP